MWPPDGTQLFFTPAPGPVLNAVRVVSMTTGEFGEEERLPRPFSNAGSGVVRPFDISHDGLRFLGLMDPTQSNSALAGDRLNIVLHWFEELKAWVPLR